MLPDWWMGMMVFESGYRAVHSSTASRADSASPLGSPNTSRPRSGGALSRLRAQLLGGVSGIALPAASMALALGVGLSTEASAQSSYNSPVPRTTTYTLTTGTQTSPFTFGPLANITTTTSSDPEAVRADAGTNWNVTNHGTLSGFNSGILLFGSGTVTNSGYLAGTTNFGVGLGAGGSVTNQLGGVISGYREGIYVSTNAGTVTNAGSITGTTRGPGVYLKAGGSVTNSVGGVITGGGSPIFGGNYGVQVKNALGTVINYGSITGTYNQVGVKLEVGGSVTNQVGGVITGGVNIYLGTVINSGSVTGGNGTGVFVATDGVVTNQNGGTISGGFNGVNVNGNGTVTNAGTITGVSINGVYVYNGSVTNKAGGVIRGGRTGIYIGYGRGAGTVTNAGTITGATNSVLFAGSGPNALILQTGSVLNGDASGSTASGATNALILQGTGTANNNFVNFNTLDVQGSAVWTLGGTVDIGTANLPPLTNNATLTVTAGGTLFGTGTVGASNGIFINSGGVVQGGLPGGFGTLNISGNLTFNSGGILSTTIAPSGASLVNVAGLATLSGGTVQVTATAPFTATQTLTILKATAISGAFSSVSLVSTTFARNPRLSQDSRDVFLTVDAGGINSFRSALPTSASGNQVNVAKAIDAGLAGGGTLPAGFLALGNLPVTNLPGALTQLSGETATGSQQTTFQAMTQFLGLLLDPFIGGRDGGPAGGAGATPFAEEFDSVSGYAADARKRSKSQRDAYGMFTKAPLAKTYDPHWSVWAAGFGGSQTTDGNATLGSNTATSRVFGVAAGADYRFSPYTIAGFALAGGGTNFNVNGFGTGRSDLFQAGAFVRHTVGPAYISAALAYGWQDVTTDRTVTVAGIDRLRAEFNANAFSGRIEGGYRFVAPWAGGIGITPYAAGQFTTFDLPVYAEQAIVGSNQFALAYGAKSVTDTRSELGIRTDKSWAMQSAILTLRGRLAWAHDFNPDRTIAATFQSLPGASFVVGGAAQAHESALTTASAEMKWMNGWSAAATFEGEFSDVTRSYAGKGVVRYTW
jgi:uncharacterized protein with beta-barrel porin domain